jgi:FKBP-type peptidyl-prolyl cis-trans isomerase FkpA
MKKTLVFFAATLIATGSFAQANKGKTKTTGATASSFKTTPKGLQYMIVKDVPGANAKVGDYIEMHIVSKAGDSSLYDSRKMNNNQPVPFQIQQPQFNGDLAEGFTLLSAGDSAVFKIPVDSMLKAGAQLLPWMKKDQGMMIEYYIAMTSVKSADQMRKEAEENAAKQVGIDEKLLTDYFKANNIKATKTASGLYYTISQKGTGENASAGDTVTVNYTGKLINGNAFDSNTDPKFQHVQPFSFVLGRHQVISGWDEGIALLNKGAKGKLFIPSTMAYGSQAKGNDIPSNSILIFDVELVDFKKGTK